MALAVDWIVEATRQRYPYQFQWMGRPIIQFPADIVAMQEILWKVEPDLVVETGIAHGGSLLFYASLLELMGGDRLAVGVDVDIRAHNRKAIEEHRMAHRVRLIEGSSIDPAIFQKVCEIAHGRKRVLVALDSNHTHDHVLRELELYSALVRKDSYLVVMDTIVEDFPPESFQDRPWGKGNNPKTAVREFLRCTDRFVVDRELEAKLLMTTNPEGYLRCVKD